MGHFKEIALLEAEADRLRRDNVRLRVALEEVAELIERNTAGPASRLVAIASKARKAQVGS